MWTCPKCGREFARTNQGHYCGRAPETVDEYLDQQPQEARAHIIELRNIVRESAPGAKERIAWSMPRYEKNGRSISFAACKRHVSLYLDAEALEICGPQLCGYAIRKNAVYLPYDKPLPADAIESAVRRSLDEK